MTDKYGNNANFSTSTNKFMVKGALRNFYTPHSFSLVKVRYFYTNGGNYFDSKLIINSTPEHVVPVKFYSDALKLKADILKDNRKKAGIYRWTHKSSGKTYVGSTLNLTLRFLGYFSLAFLKKELRIGNSIIYRSMLKYGPSAFSLEILEYCDPLSLISREQYYLDLLKPELNILRVAGSSAGFKHREKTKELLRIIGLKRKVSEETRLSISINNSQSKSVVIINRESGSEIVFPSIIKASDYMNISPTHFNYYLSRQPIKGKYLVTKIDDIDVTSVYKINEPRVNPKALIVCATKIDSGSSFTFPSMTKAAEFLGVTLSFLSRCVREGKHCRGYVVERQKS